MKSSAATTTGRVPRLFVESRLDGDRIALDSQQAHYLRHVLRLKPGHRVVVFNGCGNELVAEIDTLTRSGAALHVTATATPVSESELDLTLLQSIAKAEAMDLIVQKATELGVRSIAPIVTEFSIVKLDAQRVQRRLEHWQRIARSACEQSGRHSPPRISEPQRLERCLEALPQDGRRLALDPLAERTFAQRSGSREHATKLYLLVGPEGGLSSRDLLIADKAGFERAKLGPRIMRVETAAIAACTLAQAFWGDLL